MKKSMSIFVILISGLYAMPAFADTDTPTPASTTPASTAPHKHHHHHKKSVKTSESSPKTTPPASSPAADSHVGNGTGNTDAPGMSNSMGTNNPGSPNMGSSDHVPGTTGTSGQ